MLAQVINNLNDLLKRAYKRHAAEYAKRLKHILGWITPRTNLIRRLPLYITLNFVHGQMADTLLAYEERFVKAPQLKAVERYIVNESEMDDYYDDSNE